MTLSNGLRGQNAHSLVMVKPVDFGFNPQTGEDNHFQHLPDTQSAKSIQAKAMTEFENMVHQLTSHGIEVIVLDKAPNEIPQPDAVFPNNWFSIDHQGRLFVYPMKTPNRQAEVQVDALIERLEASGSHIREVVDLRQSGLTPALEGTGSLIFHHPSKRLFAAISERCEKSRCLAFAEQIGYQAITFQTSASNGKPVYHTNVLMSVGADFAVICEEVIRDDADKPVFLDSLRATVSDLVIISEQQMSEGFCGNILQVKNRTGESLIVMSASAWPLFDAHQRSLLEKHGKPILCEIPTIERIGGGSARCMIAENFSAKA